jgi:hypothetical protein
MACAQCHDHPLAEWKQRDFYQMAAFFGATDGKDEAIGSAIKKAVRADASLPKAAALKVEQMNTFRMEDADKQKLTFPKDYKYKDAKAGDPVTPALIAWSKGDKSLPVYNVSTKNPAQLRDEFARWLTSPQNPRFATNIANRVWKKGFRTRRDRTRQRHRRPRRSEQPGAHGAPHLRHEGRQVRPP